VKVLNRDVTAEKPLDHILILVISPYGIYGYLERFDSVEICLKPAE
jgi:hypothetical protein